MPSLSAVMSDESKRKSERIRKLQEENEQLKKENKKLADALTVYFENKTKKGL